MQNNTIAQPGDNTPKFSVTDTSVTTSVDGNIGQDGIMAIADAIELLVENGILDEVQEGKGTLKVTVEYSED